MRRIAVLGILLAVHVFGSTRAAPAQPLLRRLEERLRETINAQVVPAPRPLDPRSTGGRVRLGVVVDAVTPEAISRFGLVVHRGALITSVERGSVAERAGLPLGGLIVAVDGVRIDTPDQLVNIVRSTRAGQSLEIAYYEGARLNRKHVHFAAGPGAPETRPLEIPAPLDTSNSAQPPAGVTTGRPLLDRLGRVLDELAAPAGAALPLESALPRSGSPQARSAAAPADEELRGLRDQVAALQSQIDRLTERIAELERRLESPESGESSVERQESGVQSPESRVRSPESRARH